MKCVLCGAAVLYGLLHIYVSLAGKKQGKMETDMFLAMLLGACLLTAAGVWALFRDLAWIPALIGCVLISLAAFVNGGRASNRHLSHHLIRAAVHLLLVLGFVFL